MYAFFANSGQEVSVRAGTKSAWLAVQGVGAAVLTVAGNSWAGFVLAWLVTIVCARPFYQIRRTKLGTEVINLGSFLRLPFGCGRSLWPGDQVREGAGVEVADGLSHARP